MKDFVVGGMLSLAGFSFGKAVDRSREARERWLQVNKVYQSINDIEANARFASEALWKITDPSAATVLVDCRKRMAESIRLQERLHLVGTKHTDLPVKSQLYVIESYLRAAQRRSAEFAEVLDAKSIRQPNTFGVMCQDVRDALAEVGRMAAAVGHPARTGVMLQ